MGLERTSAAGSRAPPPPPRALDSGLHATTAPVQDRYTRVSGCIPQHSPAKGKWQAKVMGSVAAPTRGSLPSPGRTLPCCGGAGAVLCGRVERRSHFPAVLLKTMKFGACLPLLMWDRR